MNHWTLPFTPSRRLMLQLYALVLGNSHCLSYTLPCAGTAWHCALEQQCTHEDSSGFSSPCCLFLLQDTNYIERNKQQNYSLTNTAARGRFLLQNRSFCSVATSPLIGLFLKMSNVYFFLVQFRVTNYLGTNNDRNLLTVHVNNCAFSFSEA